jgi:hypothetical protein
LNKKATSNHQKSGRPKSFFRFLHIDRKRISAPISMVKAQKARAVQSIFFARNQGSKSKARAQNWTKMTRKVEAGLELPQT